MIRILSFGMLAVVLTPAAPRALFNGKNLQGWKVCAGKATYRVENGTIVGRTTPGSPNSFLCTDRAYGDFVLEFETKVDADLNSGVQIRSAINNKGIVYGYQVEVTNDAPGTSGGIYDEERRGWLDNISADATKRAAYKEREWNKYRVEAEGDHIRVHVNGVPTADLVDSEDLDGYIALQVHSYKGDKPVEVHWRNITIDDRGWHLWRPLFDGKSLSGWTHSGGGEWTVEEAAIHGRSKPDDPRIGFLISDLSQGNITSRARFRIPKGNSGFFVRADKETLAGYEVEVDAEKRTGGFWEVRGRNWVTGPEDNAGVKPWPEWNQLTASLHGDRIVFHLNGRKTVDLPSDTQGRKEGHLAVQAHGAKRPTDVWFKDIEVMTKETR